ncbi:MAG: hypothetical protein GF308_12300 [Candidatus Heimdallarchaeota archaeon]|nr:hypothetical protein [Candidatus Heimdallarchaeota archaeon]
MKADKEQELKQLYIQRLFNAGYNSIESLIELDPPTIMNIIQSNLPTAENLFVASLKTHLKLIQEKYRGKPPQGLNRQLNNYGYRTLYELADANPAIIAKALKISLEHAGEIVLHAMELTVKTKNVEMKTSDELIEELDKELAHHMGRMDQEQQKGKLKKLVDDTVKRIYDTISLPSQELQISLKQKDKIEKIIERFIITFPACTGFALYNKEVQGIFKYFTDRSAEQTLANIHENLPELFWKINVALMNKEEYGWVKAPPHLVWLEAIRDKKTERQLTYLALFIFEARAKEGVGTATPTIKGIMKEIKEIIYQE